MADRQDDDVVDLRDYAPQGADLSAYEPAPKPSSLLRRVAADPIISGIKGTVVGIPEAAVGAADILAGGRVANAAKELFGYDPKAARETFDGLLSHEGRDDLRAVHEADGFLPTLGAAITHPLSIPNIVAESIGPMVAGGMIGRLARASSPTLSPTAAGAFGEGVVAAGSAAEHIRQESPDGMLSPAQSSLAALSGLATGAISRLGGAAAREAGISDVDTLLAGGARGATDKGLLRRIGEGALREGVFEELPQSAQEQAMQNIALGRPWDEGIGNAAALGMIAGGAMGAGAGVLSGAPSAPADTAAAAQQQTPAGPAGTLALPERPSVIPAGAPGAAAPIDPSADAHAAAIYAERDIEEARRAGAESFLGQPATLPAPPDFPRLPPPAPGIDPNAGPISRVAAQALNSGTTDALAAAAAQAAQEQGKGKAGNDATLTNIPTTQHGKEALDGMPVQAAPAGTAPETVAPGIDQPTTETTETTKGEFARQLAERKQRRDTLVAHLTQLVETDGGARASLPDGSSLLLTRGASGEPFRVTSFDKDGNPTGHREYRSIGEGGPLDSAVGEFIPSDVTLLKPPNTPAIETSPAGSTSVLEAPQTAGSGAPSAESAAKPRKEKPAVVLQNRDRSSAASVAQMNAIAANPDASRLSFSRDFANGAPVVFGTDDVLPQSAVVGHEDHVATASGRRINVRYAVVEADDLIASHAVDGSPVADYAQGLPGRLRAVAGNGRSAGIKEAYVRGSANAYREAIGADTRLTGIDAQAIAGMRAPVLVRVMGAGDVTPNIGDESNTSGVADLSPVEQAANDLRRIDIAGIAFHEETGEPLIESVRAFIHAMPPSERSKLLEKDGTHNRIATERLMNAVFMSAYGNEELVRLYAAATDAEARTVINALAAAAPDMAKLEGAGALDIREIIAEAAALAVSARRRGIKLADAAEQSDLDASPDAAIVLRMFARHVRSAKAITERLRNAARFAYAETIKESADMFGVVERATRAQVLEILNDGQAGTQDLENKSGRQPARRDDGRGGTETPSADDAEKAQGSGPAAPESAATGSTEEVASAERARALFARLNAQPHLSPAWRHYVKQRGNGTFEDDFERHLLGIAAKTQEAYNALMQQHQGQPEGIEFKHDTHEKWAFVAPDAAEPGKWRVQFFDQHSFSSHDTQDTREHAIEEMLRSGFVTPDKGVLDRLSGTRQWARGLALLDLIRQRNAGKITEAQFNEKVRALDPETAQEGEPKPGAKIADFGEKIGGARKDVWQSYKDELHEAEKLDLDAQPLSKSWPAPDYQSLLDNGADPWAVAFMHAARDAIPAKPKNAFKLKEWVKIVRSLRGLTMQLADGTASIGQGSVMATLNKLSAGSRYLTDIAGRTELYQLVGHSKSLDGVRITSGEYSIHEGVEYKPAKVIWTVEKQATATALSNWPRILASGATKEEALSNFKDKYDSLIISQPASREVSFEVYSKRGEKGYYVGKKLGRNPALLAGPFPTIKEARAYKDTHHDELVAKLEQFKAIPNERRDVNNPRVGEDMRGGRDVTPQMFSETFGFRGVEFGNWVEQKKRQKDLNDAFDALMDMAAIIGVPPKALSLNGELGIAFGARGKGGIGASAAHYEPDFVAINITKKEGAGSIGHEWFHALDNYFSRMRGDKLGNMTEGLDVSLAARGSRYEHRGAVRKEMIDAFGEVVRAIRSTAMAARAAKLDAKRSKDYWTTGPEMAARAYESYLIAKLQDQNASNDYLANIVSEDAWKAAEAMGFELDESYPYPIAGEIPAIRAAFDRFFQTIETQATERGIALRQERADYDEFALTGETPAQLKARLKKQAEEEKARKQAERAADEKAHADALRDTFELTGSDRSADTPGQGSLFQRTKRDEYTTDLFGNPLPLPEAPLRPHAGVRPDPTPPGHLVAAGAVPGAKFATVAGPRQTGTLKSAFERVRNAAQAAHVLAGLRRFAQEHFALLVLDKDHRPLSVSYLFAGATTSTSVYPEVVTKAAYEIPGAAHVWLAHNHPSGLAEPSNADIQMTRIVSQAFGKGSGIEVAGHVIIAGGRFAHLDARGNLIGKEKIAAGVRRHEVTITERTYRKVGALTEEALANPSVAKRLVPAIAQGKTGIVFTSSQNVPVAFLPMSVEQMKKLRDAATPGEASGARILFGAVARANASSAVLHFADDVSEADTMAALKNLHNALSVSRDVKMLDAIQLGDSFAESMGWNFPPHGASGEFFSTGRTPFSDAFLARRDEAAAAIKAILKRIAPTANLELVDRLFADVGAGRTEMVAGSSLGSLIRVALNYSQPDRTAWHEALHHLKAMGLITPAEWKILERRARKEWLAKYDQPDTERGIEEAIAMALEDIRDSQITNGVIARVIAKLDEFFTRLASWLNGNGFTRAEDVFARIARGEVGSRSPTQPMRGGSRYGEASAQRAPVFYSALLRAVAGARMNAAPANGWLAFLKGLPAKGVKADEIHWSGIEEFLKLQSGKVTREQVSAYLEANGVRVEERLLSGQPALQWRLRDGNSVYDERYASEDEAADARKTIARELAEQEVTIRKHSDGGASVGKVGVDQNQDEYFHSYDEALARYDELVELEESEWRRAITIEKAPPSDDDDEPSDAPQYNRPDLNLPGGQNYRELLLTLPKPAWWYPGRRDAHDDGKTFVPAHFGGELNLLAHVRFDERTGADGKRVLFIQEIQSDWNKEGREQGFPKDTTGWTAQSLAKPDAGFTHWEISDANGNYVTRIVGGDKEGAIRKAAGGIPAAPFITKTEAYVALVLKRIIRYAAENGFERVAWTTGEQQADRYSLAHQVNKIEWSPKVGSTTQHVIIDTMRGPVRFDVTDGKVSNEGANTRGLLGKPLEDVIGKEAAKKITAAHRGTMEGDGLKIGGHGMRKFYDEIVHNVANDILKKLGGARVGSVDLRTGNERATGFDSARHVGVQPGFEITPALAETALRGLPMFSRGRDQTQTPEFQRWFGDSKVVDEQGRPLVVYHGTRAGIDFDAFADNSHFGTRETASVPASTGGIYGPGRVIPVYLSIENPKLVKDQSNIGWGQWDDVIEQAKAEGHDGLVYTNTAEGRGTQSWVAFRSEQIKSALSNTGSFDPHNPDIRYSRGRDTYDDDPELASFMRKAGMGKPATYGERVGGVVERARSLSLARIKEVAANWWTEVRQGALDQFHGIKLAERSTLGNVPTEQSAYVAARFSTGLSSIMRGLLVHGAAQWMNDVRLQKVPDSKGLLAILEPVKDDLDAFLGWMVARRAQRLMGEERENNFSEGEIGAGLKLAQGREDRFKAVADEFAAFKRSVLDVAEQAGLIDADSRAVWDHLDWIPFYRVREDGDGTGPKARGRDGFSHQTSGIRRLRGGEAAINDPLENIILNFTHLIDASLKNNVLRQTIRNTEDSGLMSRTGYEFKRVLAPKSQVKATLREHGVPEEFIEMMPSDLFRGIQKMWSIQQPADKDVVRVMENGKPAFYRVSDPLLLRAVTALTPTRNPAVDVLRSFRRVLTRAVTATPDFMIRNFVRDALSAGIISKEKFNFADSLRGIGKSYKESGGFEDMLFAGASFAGGYIEGADPQAAARQIRRTLLTRGFNVGGADAFVDSLVDNAKKYWSKYREMGESFENANREALYEATIKAGKGRTEAAFESKDLLDFSLRGSWSAYQFFADVLPFFNARMQGLYRLGRTDPRQLMVRGSLLTVASLMLLAANDGDDEYEQLPDWDKDNWWHIFVGGEHLRIPKPFEIGAVFATVPERMARWMAGRDSTGKFGTRLLAVMRDQLEVNPIPQAFKPLAELWANQDTFTGNPIETQSDEGKLPHLRYHERTSETARALTSALSPITDTVGLSPKQIEHLVRGYLGTLGMYALGLSDLAVRGISGMPESPSWRTDDYPLLGSFLRSDPPRSTVYRTDLYDMAREADAIFRSVRALQREGDHEGARALREAHSAEIAAHHALTPHTRTLNQLRHQKDRIYRDENLSAAEKRARLDNLQRLENRIAERAYRIGAQLVQ